VCCVLTQREETVMPLYVNAPTAILTHTHIDRSRINSRIVYMVMLCFVLRRFVVYFEYVFDSEG